jgi:hypothetical protein
MATLTLEGLTSQLRGAFGDALRAVVLYGSAAGGDTHGKHSDQNVLVIVREIPPASLAPMGALTRAWNEAGNPAPLTMTEAEWRSSLDVFAIEHADIRERHRILYAADGYQPIGTAAPHKADLRQQLEYEAMGTLLRFRGAAFASAGSSDKQSALLTASLSQVLVLFRAVLRLCGETPATDAESVCKAVAAHAGLDAAPFLAVVQMRRGGDPALAASSVPMVVMGYHEGLQRLVAFLDAMPTG